MARPAIGTYSPGFATYIQKVQETDIFEALKNQQETVNHFFQNIPEEKHGYAYAPGKWTLKDMMQHLIDSERVINYRSLCFARQERSSLPSFDEDLYAANANAKTRTWESLCNELKAVREGTNYLYQSFNEDMLVLEGVANNNTATALSMGFATVGHLYHHVYVIETKYLVAAESC